jgi:hypothetical protein
MAHENEVIHEINQPSKPLSATDREKLAQEFLPAPRHQTTSSAQYTQSRKIRRKPVRSFFKQRLFQVTYFTIQVFFGIYIRLRQLYHFVVDRIIALLYYHHRTPELIRRDVSKLDKLPEHISFVLSCDEFSGANGLEKLIDEVSEITAWSAAAGLPRLSIYERNGVLKDHLPSVHRAVAARLVAYFGETRPALNLHAPHLPPCEEDVSPRPRASDSPGPKSISVLLLSYEDGRDSLVDLTKTLAEMTQRQKISSADITVDLVDAELSESIMEEPDLLVLFTPTVQLQGYPPWPLRLTEIFHVQDNRTVGYQVFLRALYSFAKAEMRFGR